MSEPNRIVLVGASGLIGTTVIAEAVGRSNVRLIALARREFALPKGARMDLQVAPSSHWPGLIASARADAIAADSVGASSTQHVFRDLYRMQVARSLLVIDQDSCVRCGHCAWSCAEVHGQTRLIRRGSGEIRPGDLQRGDHCLRRRWARCASRDRGYRRCRGAQREARCAGRGRCAGRARRDPRTAGRNRRDPRTKGLGPKEESTG